MARRRGRAGVFAPVHKGAIAELLVANALTVQSDGRLKVFRSWPDDHGVDCRVALRGAASSLELQVKSDFSAPPGGACHFIIDLADIPPERRQYKVLACAVDEAAGGLRPQAWLIPGSAFPRARPGHRSFSWSPPVNNWRRSKWDHYRIGTGDLARAVERDLVRLQPRGARPLPAARAGGLPPFTVGFVSENALIVAAALGSHGRIAAFRPVADVVGVDVVFEELEGRVGVAAQVKGDFIEGDGDAVVCQVDPRTFRARDDRLLIVAPYIPSQLRLARTAWLMTTEEFARRAVRRSGKLNFYGSPRAGARDRFARFRCPVDQLAGLLEACIAVRARGGMGARLPTGGNAAGKVAPWAARSKT